MSSYQTIEKESSDEFVEQRSKFIGYVKPVAAEQEAIDFINEKRQIHWDATHNVYAYVLRDGQIKRFSDDGEPHGTAGMPVLDVILKSDVTDVAVVVTRYFGGILLGAGGLVRAYTKGAKIALEAGGIVTMEHCCQAVLRCDYNQYGKISGLIPANGGVIDNTEFSDMVDIEYHITQNRLAVFEKQLADATCGSVCTEVIGERYYKMK
ncbi:MAG: YigZ family protein [Clostridia bacterium]|nr:YigZ family protein [Clostridia bacterium]